MDSGSREKDSPVSIITMQKEEEACLVHNLRLGKGQRHTHKTGQTLSKGVIPALHMSGLSRLFAYSRVVLFGNHAHIDFQKVGTAMALAILLRNRLPQSLTRLFTPLPNRIRHHLTRFTTQGDPNPRVVRFFEDKCPQFGQF